MKETMQIVWHMIKAIHYWNRIKVISDRMNMPHGVLLDIHATYRLASERYNESINTLHKAGYYVTARSLIKNKRLHLGNAR